MGWPTAPLPCCIGILKQPQANIIETVDLIRAMLPRLRADIPPATQLDVAMDRSTTIRASLRDVERSLAVAIVLVILVVYLFLRDGRATLIPSVAVPVSLIGTFGAMYLLGYSLDNLSLMALTIATGFVVDDAIVVMENITRHMEMGKPRFEAALIGVRQVAFTVLSMSLSLIAVFIPILLMGGQVGRTFREFAVTLSVAILISMVISLTTTPMMCARLLTVRHAGEVRGRFHRWTESAYQGMLDLYRDTLAWALRHSFLMIIVLLCTVGLNVWLFTIIQKGFFPPEDTGRMNGFIQADQSVSFQRMSQKLRQYMAIVQNDPDVADVVGFTGAGGRGGNTGALFISAKPLSQRKLSSDQIIARLRPKLAHVPGGQLFMFTQQETPRTGGRGQQHGVAVHPPVGQSRRPAHVDSEACGRAQDRAGPLRPELGPAGQGPRDVPVHRPEHRVPPPPDRRPDRQHPLRRLWPAAGLDDLRAPEPVPRGHGGRAAFLAGAVGAQRHICQLDRRDRERHAVDERRRRHGVGILRLCRRQHRLDARRQARARWRPTRRATPA